MCSAAVTTNSITDVMRCLDAETVDIEMERGEESPTRLHKQLLSILLPMAGTLTGRERAEGLFMVQRQDRTFGGDAVGDERVHQFPAQRKLPPQRHHRLNWRVERPRRQQEASNREHLDLSLPLCFWIGDQLRRGGHRLGGGRQRSAS